MKRTVASVLLGLSLLFTPLTFNYSQAAAAGITAGQDVNQGKQQQLENLKQKKQGLDQRLIELQTKVDNYHEKKAQEAAASQEITNLEKELQQLEEKLKQEGKDPQTDATYKAKQAAFAQKEQDYAPLKQQFDALDKTFAQDQASLQQAQDQMRQLDQQINQLEQELQQKPGQNPQPQNPPAGNPQQGQGNPPQAGPANPQQGQGAAAGQSADQGHKAAAQEQSADMAAGAKDKSVNGSVERKTGQVGKTGEMAQVISGLGVLVTLAGTIIGRRQK